MKDNEKERAEFFKIMVGMAENFSAQMSSAGMLLRFKVMKEYSLQQIEAAALKILANRKIMGMPTVAEFVVAISGDRKACDNAEGQASDVIGQVRSVGSYGTPVFDDPVTKLLMSGRWSWRSVCAMTEAEMKWWARDFVEAYQAFERKNECLEIGNEPGNRKLRLLTGGIGN